VLSGGSLLAVRLFSVGLGAGVVILAFAVARAVFPHRPAVALGAMAFTAFVPMHLSMLASVNNDALAELLIAAMLLLLVRRLAADGPPSPRSLVLLGALLGLGLVTKVTVYIAVPLIALTLWLTIPTWQKLLRQGVIIFGLALVIALPWYGRNAALYGGVDILGLGRHNAVVAGQLRTADYLAQVGWPRYAADFLQTTFRSFWGQFGWMAVPMDGRTYLLLLVLTGLAVVGLGLWAEGARWLPAGPRPALALLALTELLMAAGYGWYNLGFVQFQGRYLFPALIPLGLFFTVGLAEILAWPRRGWLIAGLLLALAAATAVGFDKWAALWLGLALAAAVGRAGLGRYYRLPEGWLLAAVYLALGALALLSPFWFIAPYLAAGP
jgi:4-amino-4-deoxy-L-arabinose transferase-like glycosyltransferase